MIAGRTMPDIHPTAIVAPDALLDDSVSVGPFSIVDSDVQIGAGCRIASGVRIFRGTRIGRGNIICHGAMLGTEPQDLTFSPENSRPLTIGNNNHVKEGVNISRGVKTEAGTRIGDGNYLMGNFHAGHDCVIGNRNILGHGSVLAGHVAIGDDVFISGLAAIHQFCRIGNRAMIAGCAKIVKDIPPFTTGDGNPARLAGLNSVGMRRGGMEAEVRLAIKRAYQTLFHSGMNTRQALERLSAEPRSEEVQSIIDFFLESERGITAHR